MTILSKIPVIVVFMSIFLLFFSAVNSVRSISTPEDLCSKLNATSGGHISINTDMLKYVPGQVVEVFGNVNDNNGNPVNTKLNLNILDPNNKNVGGEQTCTPGGKYDYNLTNTAQDGTYKIIASTNNAATTTSVKVVDLFTPTVSSVQIPILGTIIFFLFAAILAGILIWLPGRVTAEFTKTEEKRKWRWPSFPWCRKPQSKQQDSSQEDQLKKGSRVGVLLAEEYLRNSGMRDDENNKLKVQRAVHELFEVERNLDRARIGRFICISGMVVSIITIYAFLSTEIGDDSSLGLVRIHDINSKYSTQWVMNIGGAIHVPFYVLVFGILGGYLRYLYTTAYPDPDDEPLDEEASLRTKGPSEVKKPKKPADLMKRIARAKDDTDEFLGSTIKKLALIFLAPLLAIAIWFVVSGQQTYTNIPILAALSLAIGLVTKEVVEGLISFAKGHITHDTTPSNKTFVPSEEEQLSTMKVKAILDKFPWTKTINSFTLEDKISEVKKNSAGVTDVLVVKKDNTPLGVLYLQDLNGVLPPEKTMKGTDLDKRLEEVIGDISSEFITGGKWDKDNGVNNFVRVKPEDTLSDAKRKMDAFGERARDVRCVVMGAKGPVGIFSLALLLSYQ